MASRGLSAVDNDTSEVVVGGDWGLRFVSWNLLLCLLRTGDLLP